MSNTLWLDRTARKLRRAGLPTEYIERTIVELADHATELEERNGSPESNSFVDSSEDLTKQLIRTYRRSKWYRRVPSLAWLLVPLPLSIAVGFAFHASMLFIMGVTYLDLLGAKPTAGLEVFIVPWLLYLGKFAAPLIACYLLFKFLDKAARPAWVHCCSIAILAYWFLATSTKMSLPNSTSDGSFNVTIDPESIGDAGLIGWQIFQATFVIGIALVEKYRRKVPPADIPIEIISQP